MAQATSNLDSESLVRNFTHLVIPAEIWLRRDISIQAKALWSEIRSLHSKEKGGCFASDQYLMEFINLKRSRFFEVLKEIKDKGLLENVGFYLGRTVRKAVLKDLDEELVEIAPDCQSGIPDSESSEKDTQSGIPDCSVRNTGSAPYIESKEESKDNPLPPKGESSNDEEVVSVPREKKKKTNIPPEIHSLYDRFLSAMKEGEPSWLPPSDKTKSLQKLHEMVKKGRNPDEIIETLSWALQDRATKGTWEGWSKLIVQRQAIPYLDKKYAQIRGSMKVSPETRKFAPSSTGQYYKSDKFKEWEEGAL